MPVLSSGQWGGQAFKTYRRTGTLDILYLAGGGILAPPDGARGGGGALRGGGGGVGGPGPARAGPGGGVEALRRAWEAALAGLTLQEAARRHPEFGRAVRKFGKTYGVAALAGPKGKDMRRSV